MKKLLLILLCLPLIGFGQGWEHTFGDTDIDELGYSVTQTNDGGYVLTGNNEVYDPVNAPAAGLNWFTNILLLKVNSLGIKQWEKNFANGIGKSVSQTSDGGYIITGQSNDCEMCASEVMLLKTDYNGNQIWRKDFGMDKGYFVRQTSDGGFIITGTKDSIINGNWVEKVFLLKTDLNGNEEWRSFYGGINNDYAREVVQTSDGGFIIVGETQLTSTGSYKISLTKTNYQGNLLWTNSSFSNSGNGYAKGESVIQTSDGGYIITGVSELGVIGGDVILIKTDSLGNESWVQPFSNVKGSGYSIKQTLDGGYIIGGSIIEDGFFSTTTDAMLMKTNHQGDTMWIKYFGTEYYNDQGYSVEQTSDGGYILTGVAYAPGSITSAAYRDIYLIKTDGTGTISSTFNIPINPNRKLEKVVDILGKETKPQTNTPFIEIYDDGTVEKRIVIE